MRRRELITTLGSATLLGTGTGYAQTSRRPPTVGILWHAANPEQEGDFLPVLMQAFESLGYVDGRSVRFEQRFPAERPELFEQYAKELVDLKVDLIVAVTSLSATNAKRFTQTIPIVFVIVPDPVGTGLVSNLARPDGNATGLSLMTMDLTGKLLGFLRAAVPDLGRVGLILETSNPGSRRFLAAMQATAAAADIAVSYREVQRPEHIDGAMAELRSEGVQGLLTGPGPLLYNERAKLGAAALAHRLPLVVNVAEIVPYGALMSYGQDFPEFFRKAAVYADRLLRGAKPSDLPVEQPTRFKLVINAKAALKLGLTLPDTLLAQADDALD